MQNIKLERDIAYKCHVSMNLLPTKMEKELCYVGLRTPEIKFNCIETVPCQHYVSIMASVHVQLRFVNGLSNSQHVWYVHAYVFHSCLNKQFNKRIMSCLC